MFNYLEVNQTTYDLLAANYQENIISLKEYDYFVPEAISNMLMEQIYNNTKAFRELYLLELGCGVGALLKAFQKFPYVHLYAVDFSVEMIKFAKKNCPSAMIEQANVLDIKNINSVFNVTLEGKVDILVMSAFIHCFLTKDAITIMKRIRKWIAPDGLVYLDTTDEEKYQDGVPCVRTIENSNRIIYFRTLWNRREFNKFLKKCGYRILRQEIHQDSSGRKWIRTIINKA